MAVRFIVPVVLFTVVTVLVAVHVYGAYRWNAAMRDVRRRLDAARMPTRPSVVDLGQLAGLPAPVQEYLRSVLKDGQAVVAGVWLEQIGELDVGEGARRWRTLRSTQRVVTRRPGFGWDARVTMRPLLPVRVRDAYVTGEGVLHAVIAGVVTVANVRGRGQVAQGELTRFLAEAAWYPTALLPGQGLSWTALGDRSARATLVDGPDAVSLHFDFDAQGLIATVSTEARGRTVGNETVPTPRIGRFWNYAEHGGIRPFLSRRRSGGSCRKGHDRTGAAGLRRYGTSERGKTR